MMGEFPEVLTEMNKTVLGLVNSSVKQKLKFILQKMDGLGTLGRQHSRPLHRSLHPVQKSSTQSARTLTTARAIIRRIHSISFVRELVTAPSGILRNMDLPLFDSNNPITRLTQVEQYFLVHRHSFKRRA